MGSPKKRTPAGASTTTNGTYEPLPSDDKTGDDKFSKKKAVKTPVSSSLSGAIDFRILAGLLLLAVFVRFYKISHPTEVVFDEVHFGKFAGKYIKSEFFMDVHPPLGKLLITAAGVLSGYNGTFDFKEIGLDYVANSVPYIGMRSLTAALGVALIPMSYITMRNMGASQASSVLAAVFLTFENGLTCQSRLILLDSILVFFTALTIMMWTEFLASQDQPFTFMWWFPLIMTGVCLGLSLSVKWVGLFVIATVGLSTIKGLWDMIDDSKTTITSFSKHFAARAFALIAVPAIVYMAIFHVHFIALSNTGSGSSFMSPEFQSTLTGSDVPDTYSKVAYYSKVTIRHMGSSGGGYLHSHRHFYPAGSKQQQITCYPFRDLNSDFLIKPPIEIVQENNDTKSVETTRDGFVPIRHGDIIRLEHMSTQRRLHSHEVRPTISDDKEHNEASGYGEPGFLGDTNDHWRVEFVDRSHASLKAMSTKFRLVHVNTGCKLFSHALKLPEWGFGQNEVTCAKRGRKDLITWAIEANDNERLPPNTPKVNYKKPGFFDKFLESHQVMWTINNGLTSSHPFDSRPTSWPLLNRGISFWQGKKEHYPAQNTQIYLIGNPLVWIASTLAIIAYIALVAVQTVCAQRQITVFSLTSTTAHLSAWAGLMFTGWALHYLTFFLMGRQLFLHHYFPALYFAIMCLSLLIDIGLVQAVRLPSQKWIAIGFISIAVMYVFSLYSPLTYGIPISNKAQCERLKLRSGWDWDCNRIGVTLETATGTSVEKPIAPVVNKDQFEEEKPADHTVV